MIFKNSVPVYDNNNVLVIQSGQICCYECVNCPRCNQTEIPVKTKCNNFESIIKDI